MKPETSFDPDYVALDLTYRCSLRCAFCFMERSRKKAAAGKELTLREIKKLVDSLSARPREFYLAGGEPTLRRDLPEIVRHIKRRGHRCLITTNALALGPALTSRLIKAGLDEVTVSLHGLPAMHDRLVGVKGAAARVEKFLLSSEARAGKCALTIWSTVNRLNHARLHEVYLYFKSLGAGCIAFNQMDYITRADLAGSKKVFSRLGAPLSLKASEGLVSGIDVPALAREIKKIKAERDPSVRFDMDLGPADLRAWYSPKRGFKKRGFCLAQWKGLWIGPRGEVITCQPLGHVFGNVREKDALEIFNGPAFNRFRAELVRCGGFLPTCSRCGRTSYNTPQGTGRGK